MKTFKLVLAASILCLSVIVGLSETILRIADFTRPQIDIPDPILGNRRRPGQTFLQNQEGYAKVSINKAGYRGPEWKVQPNSSKTRIAILGDSFMEALQIPYDRSFAGLLPRTIRCDNIETLNFGITGYGTTQQFLQLDEVIHYQPDRVVLAVFPGNDIFNNSKTLEGGPVPYFVRNESHEWVIDYSFVESRPYKGMVWRERSGWFWLQRHSRLFQLLLYTKNLLLDRMRFGIVDSVSGVERGSFGEAYAPKSSAWLEAWNLTETILTRIHKKLDRHSIPLDVIVVTSSFQVHPDPQKRRQYLDELNIKDPHYPEVRLRIWGNKYNVKVTPLASAFARHARKHQVYIHGFENSGLGVGHWNEHGHRLAAKAYGASYDCRKERASRAD